MPGSNPSLPVVVTAREVERVLTSHEAVGQINEAAQQDAASSPVERAAAAAAIGNVLRELRKAEAEAGAKTPVLTTPHHSAASRLQSLIASGEAADTEFVPLPAGGEEAKFDTHDWVGWATVAWQKLKHLIPHKMVRPKSSAAEPLNDETRIALLGDWGTGLYGAPRMAAAVRNDPDPFAMLLHLGDVYYSGTTKEVAERFLDVWPYRDGAVNRALNSNHEMYSGGEAYFRATLPRFGQEGSYFACQNKNWTLVGLDVAYHDHDIDDEQVVWLEKVLAAAGERKVIFFSHHQLYSHFESQGSKLWGHTGFNKILTSGRVFAWYWGHEHRCTIFEGRDSRFNLLARCIGHGGMPQSRNATRGLPRAGQPEYEPAEWRRSRSLEKEGNTLPDCVVLEGRNELIPGEEDLFTPHGYAVLTLDGPRLIEQVCDPDGKVIYQNKLAE